MGLGLGRDARHRVVPAPRDRGRQRARRTRSPAGSTVRSRFGVSQSGRYLHDFLYLRLQHGRGRAHGVRRADAAPRRRQEDLHQFPLRPARPLVLGACRHALSRRRLSVQLSGDHRRVDRTQRRPAGALPRGQQLPEDHQDRYRARILSGTRLAGRDRHAGQCARDAGQCAACSCSRTCSMRRRRTPSPRMTRPARSRPIRSMPARRCARCSSRWRPGSRAARRRPRAAIRAAPTARWCEADGGRLPADSRRSVTRPR